MNLALLEDGLIVMIIGMGTVFINNNDLGYGFERKSFADYK